jgi:hypothetical protein
LLHTIAVARLALLNVVTESEHSVLPRARYTAEVTRLHVQLAWCDEQLCILRSRLQGIPAPNRPHHPGLRRRASSASALFAVHRGERVFVSAVEAARRVAGTIDRVLTRGRDVV